MLTSRLVRLVLENRVPKSESASCEVASIRQAIDIVGRHSRRQILKLARRFLKFYL